MALTKKQEQEMERLKTIASLHATYEVLPDVPPPEFASEKKLTKGWLPLGATTNFARVEKACSSSIYHGTGYTDKTTTQGSRALFSTKLLALRALRFDAERAAAETLRRIDRQIEAELAHPTPL